MSGCSTAWSECRKFPLAVRERESERRVLVLAPRVAAAVTPSVEHGQQRLRNEGAVALLDLRRRLQGPRRAGRRDRWLRDALPDPGWRWLRLRAAGPLHHRAVGVFRHRGHVRCVGLRCSPRLRHLNPPRVVCAAWNFRKCSPWPVRAQSVQRRGSPVAGSGRSVGIDGRLARLVVFGEDVNAHRRVPEEGARVHAAQLGGLDERVEDRRDLRTAT